MKKTQNSFKKFSNSRELVAEELILNTMKVTTLDSSGPLKQQRKVAFGRSSTPTISDTARIIKQEIKRNSKPFRDMLKVSNNSPTKTNFGKGLERGI